MKERNSAKFYFVNPTMLGRSRTEALQLIALVLALLWTAGIAASLMWNIKERQAVTLEEAKREVRAYLNEDLLFRNWVAELGGIYLPSNETAELDPILSKAPDGTVMTPGGKKLTWASHAFVTKILHKRAAEKLKAYGRIVSLNPIDPENTPDSWERDALKKFESGLKEVAELTSINGEAFMRVMQPIVTQKSCLQCHGNDEVGGIRGGISVSIPMAPYYAHELEAIKAFAYTHGGIWLIGLLVLSVATHRLSRRAQELDAAETALRESEEMFHKFSAVAQYAVLFMDNDGNIAYWNKASETVFGYTADEVMGKNLHELLAPERYHEAFKKAFPTFQRTGKGALVGKTAEFMAKHKNGNEFPIELSLSSTQINGKWYGLGIVRDITERKRAQEEIERALHIQRVLDAILNLSLPELTLKEVLAKSLDAVLSIPFFSLLKKGAIFLVSEDGKHLKMAVQRNLPDPLLHSCAMLPFGKCMCGKAAATRKPVFASDVDERHEIRFDGMEPHGHYCLPIMEGDKLLGVLNAYVPAGHKANADEQKFLKTVADTLATVIERKMAEERLKEMALHDPLTGLVNRNALFDRLSQALALARRHKEKFAVLYLDLDRFKEVNDNLGHEAGDELLKQAAARLRACVRESDTVARIGGDEFIILLMETNQPESSEVVARKILKALTQPFSISGKDCQIGTSIGIALYPDDGEDGETLVKNADAAMYQAKRKRNTYCRFKDSMKGNGE